MIVIGKDLSGGDFAGRSPNRSVVPSARLHDVRRSGGIDRNRYAEAIVAEYLDESRNALAVMSGKEVRALQAQQIKLVRSSECGAGSNRVDAPANFTSCHRG